jgi:hypothetical protein
MKKFINPIPDGGFPIYDPEINSVLQSELWDAIENSLLGLVSGGGSTNVIIQGGNVSDNGNGTYNIGNGIVFIDGEFMAFDAAINQTGVTFLTPATPTTTQTEYADAVTRDYYIEQKAEIVGSNPPGTSILIEVNVNPKVYLRNALATKDSVDLLEAQRNNEAASRPVLVATVTSTGTMTVNYALSGVWTCSLFATGIYEIRQNAIIPANTAVLITPTQVSSPQGVTASYEPVAGRVNMYSINGNETDKGFTIIIYPV